MGGCVDGVGQGVNYINPHYITCCTAERLAQSPYMYHAAFAGVLGHEQGVGGAL